MFFVATCISVFFGQCFAGDFLSLPKFKAEDIESQFLGELADSMNTSATMQRLSGLEDALRAMYAAVPQGADGTLSHSAVRYVLHRLFARRHGWYIRGLELGNGTAVVAGPNAGNSSQAALQVLQEWVPGYLQRFLEGMNSGRGANLRELAVFAATLEDLVHKEEQGHLLQAYAAEKQNQTGRLESHQAYEVLKTYMMIYMLGGNWTAQMAGHIERLMKLFELKVSHWNDTLQWLSELVGNRTTGPYVEPGLDFAGAVQIVGQIGDRFAAFNSGECGRLKSELVSIESAKPGRVRLVDFYKRGLHGAWEFNEKIDFLRDTGTLDESEPGTPLVIISNYVQSRTNCVAVSNFYAVCCKNECEPLMEKLESEIISSTARPSQISKVVSKMSSSSVNAPRILPKTLMQKLQDVASNHDGEVPIHGRLFAQWMHHAFPRECPYPHVSGTTSQLTADEWMERSGQGDSKATKEEMLQEVAGDHCKLLPKGVDCGHHVSHGEALNPVERLRNRNRANTAEEEEENDELPWDSSEELLVTRDAPQTPQGVGATRRLASPLNDVMYFALLSSALYGFSWVLKSTSLGTRISLLTGVPLSSATGKADKCCV